MKLIKRILILLFLLQSTVYCFVRFFPAYYNDVNNQRWIFLKSELNEQIEIPEVNKIFIGESRLNAGVDFCKIPNSWSFAAGGTTPIEGYYILKKYLEQHNKPDTLFVSYSPRFLRELFSFWPYAVRNDFFTTDEFHQICNKSEELGDTLLGNSPFLKYYANKFGFITYFQTDLKNNKLFLAKKRNDLFVSEMLDMRGARVHPGLLDSCSDLNHEVRYIYFLFNPLIEYYFHEMLTLCKEEGIHVIFESMPFNKNSFLHTKRNFKAMYKREILKMKREFPEFQISDSIWFMEDKYFGDESHLNSKGKLVLTDLILKKYFKQR